MLIYENIITDFSELSDVISDLINQDYKSNIFEYLYDNEYIPDADFLVSYSDANNTYNNSYDLAIILFSYRFEEYNGFYIDFDKIVSMYNIENDFCDWVFNLSYGNEKFDAYDYENYCYDKVQYDLVRND